MPDREYRRPEQQQSQVPAAAMDGPDLLDQQDQLGNQAILDMIAQGRAEEVVFGEDHVVTGHSGEVVFDEDHLVTGHSGEVVFDEDHVVTAERPPSDEIIFDEDHVVTAERPPSEEIVFDEDHVVTAERPPSEEIVFDEDDVVTAERPPGEEIVFDEDDVVTAEQAPDEGGFDIRSPVRSLLPEEHQETWDAGRSAALDLASLNPVVGGGLAFNDLIESGIQYVSGDSEGAQDSLASAVLNGVGAIPVVGQVATAGTFLGDVVATAGRAEGASANELPTSAERLSDTVFDEWLGISSGDNCWDVPKERRAQEEAAIAELASQQGDLVPAPSTDIQVGDGVL